jgi:hypothetical protein
MHDPPARQMRKGVAACLRAREGCHLDASSLGLGLIPGDRRGELLELQLQRSDC